MTRLSQSPSGLVNTYTYNGLGLRVGMTDSQGVHTYLCDGTSPGSPVLSDGFAVYTPGLSEHRNGASLYYANDQLGNLWTVDGTSKNQTFYEDTTGFGTLTANAGTGTTPFKFGGGNGCQTDADTSLVLMGHRYYDSRTGRFISPDPIGFGNNWYNYCNNNPVNSTDALGLLAPPFEEQAGTPWSQIIQDTVQQGGLPGETYNVTQGGQIVYTFTIPNQIGFTHIIPFFNVTTNFQMAKDFANSPIIGVPYLKGNRIGMIGPLPGPALKLAYLIQHTKPGSWGDPKHLLKGLANNVLYNSYDIVGQYNFGAVLAGLGYKLTFGQIGAGGAQTIESILQGKGIENVMENGWIGTGPPYGDDPSSQYWIMRGYNDYKNQ